MYAERISPFIKDSNIIEWIDDRTVLIHGFIEDRRIPSKDLEELIQKAVEDGARILHIEADGQHGIGGRIWPKEEAIKVIVRGPVGQRCGSMGMPGTEIIVLNSASDDVGWLNCGAKITILGDVTNGAFNAAAQGILYVQGGGGARCDTLTKHNPRFDPPQSWYFRDVGDSFAEFKAGGISVVCGVEPRNPDNILGYRPCVGMIDGIIYFRGRVQAFSEKDVKLLDISEQDWEWLKTNMVSFLTSINRMSYYEELTRNPIEWKKFIPYTLKERQSKRRFVLSITDFRKDIWEKEVGNGGLFAEYIDHDRWSVIPYIATGEFRRQRPIWSNERYLPPCAYACPTQIPTHKRTRLIREGRLNEAIELMMQYSPLPQTVCGEICPNLCMDACTRGNHNRPLNIDMLGKLNLNTPPPKTKASTGKRVAVIGGGPAGMSVAWQLMLKGHKVSIYEAHEDLGGKIGQCIPKHRLSHEVLKKEIGRFKDKEIEIHLNCRITKEGFQRLYRENNIVVIACGAHKPRMLTFPGYEHAISAYDFLRSINEGKIPDLKDRHVVVIGAGNVGMDVASEAYIYGAKEVIAIDIQKPAASGKELDLAKKKGTKIIWPKMVDRYDAHEKKVHFKDGTSMDAHLLIVAIGDMPVLDFIPPSVHSENGWIVVNEFYETSDPKVYAIGDVTGLGLVTHAIGQGRLISQYIHSRLTSAPYSYERKDVIPYGRIKSQYYGIDLSCYSDPVSEATRCMSCGTCRDCHVCEVTCYFNAINRVEYEDGTYEYTVDDKRCIGCGFCANVCPCGVWEMVENDIVMGH